MSVVADACRRAHSDAGRAWTAAAQARLAPLQEKGVIEAEPVLERLAELVALLRLDPAPNAAEEPATPFSESSSRLSFSRDRRCAHVPGCLVQPVASPLQLSSPMITNKDACMFK